MGTIDTLANNLSREKSEDNSFKNKGLYGSDLCRLDFYDKMGDSYGGNGGFRMSVEEGPAR